MEAVCRCFIFVGNHQYRLITGPKLGREPETNGFESNFLVVTLVGKAFNGLLNFTA